MKIILTTRRPPLLFVIILALLQGCGSPQKPTPHNTSVAADYLSVKVEDVKWQKLEPDWGNESPGIAILRVDPKTKATQLLIRHPKAVHIPRHWHTANETHTIIKGTYIFECEGKHEEMGPGSFNYLPGRMIHQVWAPDNGMFFITVDSAWDVNWVDGPPQRPAN